MSLEAVVGLEIHAQLETRSKLFCGCSTRFGAPPNSHTCPVCLGLPGALPVLNRRAVALAVRAALALGCEVHARSSWARKNYFYPDLPKGYQISQFDRPLATGGEVAFALDGEPGKSRLVRIHLEEDAGKNVHDPALAGERSFVDFNRGGVPLVEIVGAPDLRSGAEAAAAMRSLRQLLRALGVCDGNLEQGSLRCDANVSVREAGDARLGTRTELKNINSFRFVEAAIDYEARRQAQLLAAGQAVAHETRLWDAQARVTRSMRGKEEAHDYRYFPDPDLPELVLPEGLVERSRAELPELPAAKRRRYVSELGLSDYDAGVLTEEPEVAAFFEAALAAHPSPKGLANWVQNELLRELAGRPPAALPLTPGALAELVALVEEGTLSGKLARELFAELVQAGGSPRQRVAERGLAQVSDASSLEPLVARVLAEQAPVVESYRAGKKSVLGFLVGRVLEASGGKANPRLVSELLRRRLG